jgi:hypothetical protein
MTGLLDTNVALYLLGGRLAEPLPGVELISKANHAQLLARRDYGANSWRMP